MSKNWVALIALFASIGTLFQNCSPMESAGIDGLELSSDRTLASTEGTQTALKECRFIGAQAMSSVLRDVLGIESGDVPMLNSEGAPLRSQNCKTFNHQNEGRDCQYLNEFSSELNTQSCDASVFRISAQVFTNACKESLDRPENRTRLFPRGIASVDTIYLNLTGREVRNDEAQILQELASEFEVESEKMAAVCAAIGSSLSSINSL